MPLAIRYPAGIKAGLVSNDIVLNLDLCSTILDYAEVEIPDDLQGKSLRPIMQGSAPQDWRKSMYYHYYEYPHGWHDVKRHYGVRTERYKLIHFYNDIDSWELYDLEKDPNEINNIYGKSAYLEIQKELENELRKLKKQYRDE